jgi:hypothetical protein
LPNTAFTGNSRLQRLGRAKEDICVSRAREANEIDVLGNWLCTYILCGTTLDLGWPRISLTCSSGHKQAGSGSTCNCKPQASPILQLTGVFACRGADWPLEDADQPDSTASRRNLCRVKLSISRFSRHLGLRTASASSSAPEHVGHGCCGTSADPRTFIPFILDPVALGALPQPSRCRALPLPSGHHRHRE